MKKLSDIENLKGRTVLVRADFDVNLGDDGIVDEYEAYRIHACVPTLQYLSDAGARIIVVSHIGREGKSLRPVVDYINRYTELTVGFSSELFGDMTDMMVKELSYGGIVILENLRQDPRERAGDDAFARQLAALAEVYVNEAFANCHRDHASITGIPKYVPGYMGLHLENELAILGEVAEAEHPLVLILGGAKFGTKLSLLHRLKDDADAIVVGGALAHSFFQERGQEIGQSKIDDSISVGDLLGQKNIWLPTRAVLVDHSEKDISDIAKEDTIMDVAPRAFTDFDERILRAKTIIWNGPMGYYEGGFTNGTDRLARLVAASEARSIVGGGDTVTVLAQSGMLDKYSFVSMGGGAMLEYLEKGALIGVEALK